MRTLIILMIFLAIYMTPTIIAQYRQHHQAMAITVLNVLLGWTLLGWIGALVWSCTATQKRELTHG